MAEAFLYYVWQFQYFSKRDLLVSTGDELAIVRPGMQNRHAGPDFANAAVKIGGMLWSGSVEIHVKSSDWLAHRHEADAAYASVVLHVVWEDDRVIHRSDGSIMPALELRNRIDPALFNDYQKLIHNPFAIPCTRSFAAADPVLKRSMLDRAMVQRLEAKAAEVLAVLHSNQNDWEETTWQLTARNFGFKVNADSFQQLGRALSYRIMLKHADKPVQVEALLFGQAGFLDAAAGDDYYLLLQREYQALARKYGISGRKLHRAQWRFLRLRPANFPTVRLAQFSALVYERRMLFSRITEAPNPAALMALFTVGQSDYWRTHYRFNYKSKGPVPELGSVSAENILINTAAPLLAAWGKFTDDQRFTDRAADLLQFLPAENNSVIRAWRELGLVPSSAFDSQAMLELYNNFCQRRICLTCVIGASLLKPAA